MSVSDSGIMPLPTGAGIFDLATISRPFSGGKVADHSHLSHAL
jgi:hypothetical protein